MLPIDFDPCANCLNLIFPLEGSAGCDGCEWMPFVDDDKERSFDNIDIDGSPVNSWTSEDDDENNQYLAYCSGL